MKPMCCRCNTSSLARTLGHVDILRGMLVSALLIGVFCGMSTVNVGNLEQEQGGPKYSIHEKPEKLVWKEYYWNRAMFVGCIVIGIGICAVDILMALALDNILIKNLGHASAIWINCSLMGILVRIGFYALVWKHEVYLGLDQLADLTPTVKVVMHILFQAAIAYEGLKIVQLIAQVASQMEFRETDKMTKKKGGQKKVVAVGMIGGPKRWID